MMQKLDAAGEADLKEVTDLLRQRATVQEWLQRLDDQRSSVSERVLRKVRSDYEDRLRSTLDALATHRTAIQDELSRATSRLVAAEEEHRAMLEELEEGRLRNMIGEIDDSAWRERETEFESGVRAAAEQEDAIREETQRLRDLLDQLEDREPEPEANSFSLPEAESLSASDEEADIVDDDSAAATSYASGENDEEQPTEGGLAEADLPTIAAVPDPPRGHVISRAESEAFLDEIDRALAGAPTVQPDDDEGITVEGSVLEEDTAPKPGLKCSECGYTNDMSAWFCGVCGADVG